jgi:nucleotide-binding universal stress UspA family protein
MTAPGATSVTARRVVLGIDHQPDHDACLRLACVEAMTRGLPLHIVHAYGWPLMIYLSMHVRLIKADAWRLERSRGQALVAVAIDKATALHPGLRVTGEAIAGRPRSVLMDQASTAALLVIGSGRSRLGDAHPSGSVSRYLAAYSPCPVMMTGHYAEQPPVSAADDVSYGLSSRGLGPSDSGGVVARLAN